MTFASSNLTSTSWNPSNLLLGLNLTLASYKHDFFPIPTWQCQVLYWHWQVTTWHLQVQTWHHPVETRQYLLLGLNIDIDIGELQHDFFLLPPDIVKSPQSQPDICKFKLDIDKLNPRHRQVQKHTEYLPYLCHPCSSFPYQYPWTKWDFFILQVLLCKIFEKNPMRLKKKVTNTSILHSWRCF